jgi:hypothetical protein
MVGLLLAALSSASISYVSVRDETFGFMRQPQTIRSNTVVRGTDSRVAALLRAIEQPAMRAPVAGNLQIPLGGHSAAELQDAYFHRYFTDTADAITVRIRLKNGRTVSIVSNSQMPLMLPWVTYGLDNPAVTFDARLSRAIIALLPKSAPSYALLSGQGDMGWLPPDEKLDPTKIYVAEGLGRICLSGFVRKHPGVKMQIHLDAGWTTLPVLVFEGGPRLRLAPWTSRCAKGEAFAQDDTLLDPRLTKGPRFLPGPFLFYSLLRD